MNADDPDQQALDAIFRILVRDQHPAAASVLAREMLAALRGHGWRPTEAGPPPDWRQHGAGQPCEPTQDYLETIDAIRQAGSRAWDEYHAKRREDTP